MPGMPQHARGDRGRRHQSGPATHCPRPSRCPERDGAVPCVVFFAGSGPTDRDWRSPLLPGTNGSGAQLALALQARGVGSIRFDKVGSGANMPKSAAPDDLKMLDVLSLAHYVDEAEAAFDELAGRDGPGKIFLLGHSEGSIHASSAAVAKQADPRFGGFISLSGPSRSILDTAIEQIRAIHVKAGSDATVVDAALEDFRAAMLAPDAPAPDLIGGSRGRRPVASDALAGAAEGRARIDLRGPARGAARLSRTRPRGLRRQRRPGSRVRCGQDLRGAGKRPTGQDPGDDRGRQPRLQVGDAGAVHDQPGRDRGRLRRREPRPGRRPRRRDRRLRRGL